MSARTNRIKTKPEIMIIGIMYCLIRDPNVDLAASIFVSKSKLGSTCFIKLRGLMALNSISETKFSLKMSALAGYIIP